MVSSDPKKIWSCFYYSPSPFGHISLLLAVEKSGAVSRILALRMYIRMVSFLWRTEGSEVSRF